MKLVILPGLDGSGKLFKPLLDKLPNNIETLIVTYPDDKPMDYKALEGYVLQRLPKEEKFILLAESFAGPLGYLLATRKLPNLIAIIFVATFLRNPNPKLLRLVQRLPASILLKVRVPKMIMRRYFLGQDAREDLMQLLGDIFLKMDAKVFSCRIHEVSHPPAFGLKLTIPCFYIQTTGDRLIQPDNVEDFKTISDQLKITQIDGPHFILQSNAHDSALVIVNVVKEMQNKLKT